MAPKRPLPEQFMQPPRKCRRTVNYAEQDNETDEEEPDHQATEEESDNDHDTEEAPDNNDTKDDSDNSDDSASEFEASDVDNVSDVEDETDIERKEIEPLTKRTARRAFESPEDAPYEARTPRIFNKAPSPGKRIVRAAANKAPSDIRKDSAYRNENRYQAKSSKSRSRSASTLAEDKPWVPLTELIKRVRPENSPWVPLYPSPPATADDQNEYEDEVEGGGAGGGGGDSDDDSDGDYDDESKDSTAGRYSTQSYAPPVPIFSIMDPLHPDNPANFRSSMADLPADESDGEKSGKTTRGEDSESESSEYTGEDEEEDD